MLKCAQLAHVQVRCRSSRHALPSIDACRVRSRLALPLGAAAACVASPRFALLCPPACRALLSPHNTSRAAHSQHPPIPTLQKYTSDETAKTVALIDELIVQFDPEFADEPLRVVSKALRTMGYIFAYKLWEEEICFTAFKAHCESFAKGTMCTFDAAVWSSTLADSLNIRFSGRAQSTVQEKPLLDAEPPSNL
jgi:hypothetical protein